MWIYINSFFVVNICVYIETETSAMLLRNLHMHIDADSVSFCA